MERCDGCKFWKALGNDARYNLDDVPGHCRRHAPAPGRFWLENRKLTALAHITWMLGSLDNASDDDRAEVAEELDPDSSNLDHASWPVTTSSDWCGEHQDLGKNEGAQSEARSLNTLNLPNHIKGPLSYDYKAVEDVRRASDVELLRIPNIGKVKLKLIREQVGY